MLGFYFFRLSRNSLAIATSTIPAALRASVRISSAEVPMSSRAISRRGSGYKITSLVRFMP